MKFKILFIIINLLVVNVNGSTKKEDVFLTSSFFVVQDSLFYKQISLLREKNKQDSLVSTLKIGIKLADESLTKGNLKIAIEANSIIAEAYAKSRSYKKAILFYKKGLGLIKESKYKDNFFNEKKIDFFKNKINLQLGGAFHRLYLQEKTIKYRDSALFYYNKIINNQLVFDNPEVLKLRAKAYSNLSGIYSSEGDYDLAEELVYKAIDIHRKQNNKLSEAGSLSNLANIYIYLENYEKAKQIYKKGLGLIENDKSNLATQFKELLYENIAYTMYKLKDYKAYDYQELSYEIKDELRDKEVREMIEQIAYKYDFNKGKKLGKEQEENKRLKDQRTFWIYGAISLIVILSLLYWLNFYNLKQKNLGLKLSQTQLLQNQNIEKLKSDSQRRILNATIDGKETERKEIAETLHDSVSALLSSANLHLMATKQHFNGNAPIEIDKTQSIIAEASQKIRDLSHTLVSSVLLKFGLSFALKDMASKYSNSVLHIETDIHGVRRYHQNFEIKIYNIIQEFVNNILKHSNAKNTVIKVYEQNNRICFQISDDGIGFDKTKVMNKDGLGLNQIDARIQMMHGDFLIESKIGEGTVVSVELPIIEKNATIHV
jgi:two-component system NarL family sensor kinase